MPETFRPTHKVTINGTLFPVTQAVCQRIAELENAVKELHVIATNAEDAEMVAICRSVGSTVNFTVNP